MARWLAMYVLTIFTARFSTKEAPVSARRQLQFMRQQESEPLEEFSQRIYFMALDGFDKGNPEFVYQIAMEAFI
jgi:hypothetical protein